MITAIKETLFTPSVRVIEKDHRIVISGQSRLEDPTPFYEELIAFLEEHINEVKTHLSIDFVLNYMNSSSSKWLFHILKGLQNRFNGKKIITVNWFYDSDDDSMLEAGEVFQSLLHMPFNLVEVGR